MTQSETAKNSEKSMLEAYIQIEDALKIQAETLTKNKSRAIDRATEAHKSLVIVKDLLKYITKAKIKAKLIVYDTSWCVYSSAEALDQLENAFKRIDVNQDLAVVKIARKAIATTIAKTRAES